MPPTMSGRRRAMLSGSLSAHRRRFLATESGGAALLVVATVLALLWANSPWSDAYTRLFATEIGVQVGSRAVSMDLGHWINDGLMAVFFLVVGLEVRRDLSVGELTDRSRLVLPIIGGLGGLIVPALIYLAINPSGEAARGWGVVIGTDTAFLLGVLALVGPSVSSQLRVFLLTLTVVDDIVAVSVIGIVYSRSLSVPALLVAGAAVLLLAEFSRARVWQTWPYVVVIVVLWLATVASGLHASVAGMLAGLLVPAFTPPRDAVDSASRYLHAFRQSPMAQVGRSASQALRQAVSVNERMQLLLHPWSGYVIVPVFALANAGVDLRGGLLAESLRSPVVWGIVAGLVLGKLVGIGGSALVAARLGAGRLPQGVGPGQVLGGAALSGIGFTVSLLIAHLAFGPELREQATVGVLISLVLATGLGWRVRARGPLPRGDVGRTADDPRRPGRSRARPHPRSGRRTAHPRRVRRLRVPLLCPGDRGDRGGPGLLRRRPALCVASPAAARRAPARRAGRRRCRGRRRPGSLLGDVRAALHPPGRARAGRPHGVCR